jgi:ribosome-binding ATPase YchF (GTP1/OBG family)
MALEVGIVGLPSAGKTTLFNALTGAGAHPAKENVGMVAVRDERLDRVAEVSKSRKATPASVRVVDVGGWGAALLGRLRQADALLAVLAAYAPGADPRDDAARIELELLVADRDHVERRLERVEKQAKSGEAALKREVEELRRVLAHLDAGRPLRDYDESLPEGLEPLTTKPLLTIENGPGGVDLALEAELAELPPEEAAEFRNGKPSALDDVIRRLFASLDLVTFLTADEKEARAWTLRRGATALDAAATIHSDMARGFVRCEVVRWNDLVACGSTADAARQGLLRLEGKTYVVEDGDVLRIRFSP